MDTGILALPRRWRIYGALAGLVAYVIFTWQLLRNGYVLVSPGVYVQLLVVWCLGCVWLTWRPLRPSWLDHETLIWGRVLWCNLGIIALATLVSHPSRLLLLMLPVYALFYAAMHLTVRHLVGLALVTWLAHVALSTLALGWYPLDPAFELLAAFAFAALLGGAVLLATEMIQQRDHLRSRNEGLREGMERLQELAIRDQVTGLHNRRFILDVLQRQKALADRGQHTFTVCFCDLDHFKRVNDHYGHAVGDCALKQFADLARSMVRNVDYVARLGGEEFLLVLTGANSQAAANVAERLTARLREQWIKGTAPDFSLTVSIGITSYSSPELVDDLLTRADRALYKAKAAGRDRVEVLPTSAQISP